MNTALNKISLSASARIVWAYLRFIAATCKIEVYGSQYPDDLKKQGTGFVYAFWHNRQIVLPIIRKEDCIHCLISSSRDGEYIARVAELFGKKAIRGSTTRGGYEAMKQMMQVLRSGGIVAITPDGPLGPRHVVKPGVIQMSRALCSPVVPLAFGASKKKVFASWDRFNLPYPFSRIVIVFGPPFYVDALETDDGACQRLKEALDNTLEESEKHTKKG